MPFVNPYNFISLKQGHKQSMESYIKDEKLTGKLVCRLIAKTPMIIPDHAEKGKQVYNGKNYDAYPFMTVDGKPMVPGSSIRGVVRSVFEAMTNSCVRTNDDYYFSSRTGAPKRPGLLEKTAAGWILHEAERYSARDVTLSDADRVKFNHAPDSNGKEYVNSLSGPYDGYVLKMNIFEGTRKGKPYKSAHSVFMQKKGGFSRKMEPIWITIFEENIKKCVDTEVDDEESIKKETVFYARKYSQRFAQLKCGEKIPVWYEWANGNYYFAPSQISRNVYTRKPKDFLEDLGLQPCQTRSKLCDACALFGFAGEGKDAEAMGSRVRFSDAWCKSATPKLSYTENPLSILSSPKSSSLEFYLRLPGARFYTADSDKVTLAGRKFYWHHPNGFVPGKWPVSKEPKQTSFMQSVAAGAEFYFDVYFDGISQDQLNQLYTALTFGENEGDQFCHKLGHGKPLGFGSAKIAVEKAVVRSFEGDKYREIEAKLTAIELPEDNELRIMVKRTAMQGRIIDYPRTTPKGDIYQWFSGNHFLSNNENKREYYQFLKPIPDKQELLPGRKSK